MGKLGGYYANWKNPDRKRKIINYITYTWNLKKYNKLVSITTTIKKQTHRYREQTSGYQWGDEQGMANRGRERKVRVIMELYEITCVKFLKKKKWYLRYVSWTWKRCHKILLFRKTLTVWFCMCKIKLHLAWHLGKEILMTSNSNQYFNKIIIISNEIIYTDK